MSDEAKPRVPVPVGAPGRVRPEPFTVLCEAGKYAYCRCQKSSSFPFCDGTHRGSEVKPIKLVIDEPRTIAWCCCGRSRNLPFCDGSHAVG